MEQPQDAVDFHRRTAASLYEDAASGAWASVRVGAESRVPMWKRTVPAGPPGPTFGTRDGMEKQSTVTVARTTWKHFNRQSFDTLEWLVHCMRWKKGTPRLSSLLSFMSLR
jgi:hypothetical protein